MKKRILQHEKPISKEKVFKIFLIIAWFLPVFGLLAPIDVNFRNKAKNKRKWIGALVGSALWVFDITFIALSFDVFRLPALAVVFIVWHYGGMLGFGLLYKTEKNDQ